MGSELLANGAAAPQFIAWAIRDALSAPLQRLQIVKGWTDDGQHNEKRIRRGLLRRRAPRSEQPSLPGQRRQRRSDGLFDHHRRRRQRTQGGMAGSGLQCRPARVLLRARAGEPNLSLVDLGCIERRCATAHRPCYHHPGTRLEFADLVYSGALNRSVSGTEWGRRPFREWHSRWHDQCRSPAPVRPGSGLPPARPGQWRAATSDTPAAPCLAARCG